MNEKKKYVAVLVFTLVVGFFSGISYAYFTANITEQNKENKETEVSTASFVDVTMDYGSKIGANGVLPGHKTIKTVHIQGLGDESSIPITIAVTLTPYVEYFPNHVRYTFYEVENSTIKLENICDKASNTNDNGRYFDSMECDTTPLGNAIKTGIFEDEVVESINVDVKYNTDKTIYVLVEYINDELNPQDEEQGKSFTIDIGYSDQVSNPNLADYLIEKSNKNDATIVKVTHGSTIQTGEEARIDYRYVGANPNNYVYFGCSENCSEDNLYRIIGVIPTQSSEDGPYENRVKLIKASYYTETSSGLLNAANVGWPAPGGYGYQWNSSENNNWKGSTLQSQVLNGVYLNSLGEYREFIDTAKWYLGAATSNGYPAYTSDQFYNDERGGIGSYSGGETSMIANIGLIYPSDFGYSIGVSYRTESIRENYNLYLNNAWLYNLEGQYYEWTMISESTDSYALAWYLTPSGNVYRQYAYNSNFWWGIRPTFYLKKDVVLASGEGSIKNPYRILIN